MSMIVSRLAIVTEHLVICCYQVTKFFSTRYGFAIASSAWGPCNFGPFTDLAISVFREMSVNTLFSSIVVSFLFGFWVVLVWVSSGRPDLSPTESDIGTGEIPLLVASSRSLI